MDTLDLIFTLFGIYCAFGAVCCFLEAHGVITFGPDQNQWPKIKD